MRYTVLGPLEVERDGVHEPIRGPQVRRLFAVFVAWRGRHVSTDRLVDAMWADGSAPDGAARSVMTYVSRLRSALGDQAIVTEGSGYLLDARRIACDVDEFEAKLVEAGRALPDRSIEVFDQALVLWRGEPFGEFSDEWWALADSSRLRELRASAREQRAAALIAIGHHQRAIPDLESLVVEQPVRERPVVLLMQALHASGRQAEALRRARAFRRHLAGETGLDPSAALEQLERAIATGAADVGELIGRPLRGYVIHEAIGEGSIGRVYRATQPGIERSVAVKVIRPDLADSSDFIRRFEAEAQVVARLEHPHIVPLYDYWREPGGAYLVFRLLNGGTARDSVVTDGAWSLGRVSRLVEEIGGALIAAHAAGVTHHDVKSSNVLLDDDGRAYLTDFGIATADSASSAVDDVRDLGWLLWELLTGCATPEPVVGQAAPRIAGHVAAAPAGLDAVLAKATTSDNGYASIAELVLAWRLAVGRPDGVVSPVGSDERRLVDSARRRAAVQLARSTMAVTNPYKGLLPFDEADAESFHGRADAIEHALSLVEQRRLVAVVGASGSGKSSLVRAGVVPRLRAAGSTVVVLLPGDDPPQALRVALSEIADAGSVVDDATEMLRRITANVGRVVIVVDQFEECWTHDHRDRSAEFLATLARVLADDDLDVKVVVTIRADMLDRPLQDHDLGPWVGEGTLAISAMSVPELDDAIVAPAERVGVGFDEAVVAQLVADSIAQPGSLPLLQFALGELYDRRVDGLIGTAALDAVGGVVGALGRRAEQVFGALDPAGRGGVRELFGRLVAPGDGAPDTRRRARLSELSVAARTAAGPFVAARLLVSDRDPATREPTLEVAHEALLTRWDRLAEWIDDDRRWLTQLQHLAASSRAWDEGGRSAGELYRGSRLDAAVAAIDVEHRAVAAVERDFVEAGRQAREAEAMDARRSTRRLQSLLVGVAIALVVAILAGAVAVVQRRNADSAASEARDAAAAADTAARNAEIEALVGRVESMRSTQRDTAALLAIEAFRLSDTPRTRSALFGTFTTGDGFLDAHHLDQEPGFPGIVLADDRAVIALADGRLRTYDLDTGAVGEPWELPGERVSPYPVVAASRDGALVAQLPWADDDGTAFTVGIFDGETGELLVETEPVTGRVNYATFSDDGSKLLVTVDPEQRLVLLDAGSGDVTAEADGVAPIEEAFPIDWAARPAPVAGGRFIVGSEVGTVRLLDDETLEPVATIDRPQHTTGLLEPLDDGTVVASGPYGVTRFDLASGDTVWEHLAEAQSCRTMAVVGPADAVFCGDSFGRLVRRDLATGLVVGALDAQNGNVGALWSARDGTDLVAFGDNEAVVSRWRLDGTGPITTALAPGAAVVMISPDATKLLVERAPTNDVEMTTRFDLENEIVDIATGSTIAPLAGVYSPAWVDDDTVLGGAFTDAGLQVVHYELADRELIADGVVLDPIPFAVAGGAARAESVLAFAGEAGRTTIWPMGNVDGQRHEPTIEVDGFVQAAISPTGDRIAVGTASGTIVFDGDTGAEIGRIDEPEQRGVYITAGDQLFVSTLGGELLQYDLDTLALIRTYGGSRGFIQELTGTADGTLFAARGGDRAVALYDTATGIRLGAPIVIGDGERAFADLAIDGSLLAVGGGVDDPVRVWDLDPEHWIDAACRLAGRNLTEQEWTDNIGDLAEYRATCPEFPDPSSSTNA